MFIKEVEDWKEVLEVEFVVLMDSSFLIDELFVIEVNFFVFR